jgi:hypothetical protein
VTGTAEVADFPEILAALEENIVLARELGARTFELDRSLLAPIEVKTVVKAEEKEEKAAVAPVAAVQPPVVVKPTDVEDRGQRTEDKGKRTEDRGQKTEGRGPENRGQTLILFVGVKMGEDAAKMYAGMIAATGCAEGETRFLELPRETTAESAAALAGEVERIAPLAIVFLGRDAMRTAKAAGGKVPRGLWGKFKDIPAVAAIHPQFICDTWKDDAVKFRAGKVELWEVVKQALALVGRPYARAR